MIPQQFLPGKPSSAAILDGGPPPYQESDNGTHSANAEVLPGHGNGGENTRMGLRERDGESSFIAKRSADASDSLRPTKFGIDSTRKERRDKLNSNHVANVEIYFD